MKLLTFCEQEYSLMTQGMTFLFDEVYSSSTAEWWRTG